LSDAETPRTAVIKPDRVRALELLASCRDGCTEAMRRSTRSMADQVLKRLQPSALFGEAFIRLGCHLHPR
jgi:hypothetical protein